MRISSSLIRIRGWNVGGKALDVIYILRAHTGVDLRAAMELLKRLQGEEAVDLGPIDSDRARRVGEDLLSVGAVREAELLIGDRPPQRIAPPPAPACFVCPACGKTLKHRSECGACGWLRFGGDRGKWGRAGACPGCGFSYHYDGSSCSHCGYGSVR
jgi:hypothetical protein